VPGAGQEAAQGLQEAGCGGGLWHA
jgi:hypothetical protein